MPLYLTISKGPRADRARPVLALADQRLIADLLKRLGRLPDGCEDDPDDETVTPRAIEREDKQRAAR